MAVGFKHLAIVNLYHFHEYEGAYVTKHTVAIPLIVVSSISGLWIYLIIASAFKWINPIWWGGEEMLLPYLGSISVFVSDLLFYFIITCLLKNIIAQQGASLTKSLFVNNIAFSQQN